MSILRRTVVTTVIFTAIVLRAGGAEPSGIGLGIILGEPTGLCAKKWIGPGAAFDLAVAWSFQGDGSFLFHADYLRHTGRFSGKYSDRLLAYYGVGARFGFPRTDESSRRETGEEDDDFYAGIRIPVGFTYLFTEAPVDGFFEIVPIMDVVPATDFTFAGAIGVRYYFR